MAKTVRKRRSAQYKFEVALEAAKGMKTINEISGQHSLHPSQISQWKQHLMAEGYRVFATGSGNDVRRQEAEKSELFEQIGRLKMELEWLKKKLHPQLRRNEN